MQRLAGWMLAAGILAACSPFAPGAEDDPQVSEQIPPVKLVARLDHDSYFVRRAAAEALYRHGAEAVEALEQAAVQGSLETTHQAVQVLERLYRQGDPAAKEAAGAALRRLAQAKHEAAARRARLVVGGFPAPRKPHPAQVRRVLRPGLGGIRLQVQLPAGKKQQVTIKKKKGQLEIERIGNGEKLRLVEDAKGIQLHVTRTQNGKQQTKSYKAKNPEELKKKHPDAYKLYKDLKRFEKWDQVLRKGRAVGGIQGVPVPALPQVLPVPLPQRIVPAIVPKAVPKKEQPRPARQKAQTPKKQ